MGWFTNKEAFLKAIKDGWVQWGIDQQMFYQGFFGAAAGFGVVEFMHPYPNVETGEVVVGC